MTNVSSDISLNVKGVKDLRESFQNYVLEETLDGDNKYHTEDFGLQDAKKGISFVSFPPILHLHLKRFEYDGQRDAIVKVDRQIL
jgi:ubiquitin carboxyl-terminal hydrolase 7